MHLHKVLRKIYSFLHTKSIIIKGQIFTSGRFFLLNCLFRLTELLQSLFGVLFSFSEKNTDFLFYTQ